MKHPSETTERVAKSSFFADRTFLVGLSILFLAYVAFFCANTFMTFRGFYMSAYDIGIHDQAIWKLSTFNGFFNTIRGMNIWGDHCWFIMIFIAPFYWIAPRIETLLAIQTVALAAGAFPLASYAFRKSGSHVAVLSLSAAYLLSPVLQNMNLENAHPEVLAIPFLLWMIAAADKGAWRWYGVAFFMALICKEDIALTTFAIGIFLFLTGKRRAGAVTMIASLLYFLFCMKVALPYWNGSGFFRFRNGYWFSEFRAHIFDLSYYSRTFFRQEVYRYGWKLISPLIGLPFVSPLLFMTALPGFVINVLSGNAYLTSIDYHYNYHTIPLLFAAAAGGIGKIASWSGKRRSFDLGRLTLGILEGNARFGRRSALTLTVAILVASIAANLSWSRTPVNVWVSRLLYQRDTLKGSGKWERFQKMASMIPKGDDIALSTAHNLTPALTHRNRVYFFPNPWKALYWGIDGEKRDDPARVEWIFLDRSAIGEDILAIADSLTESREFCKVADDGELFLARRNASPSSAPDARPLCGEVMNLKN